MIESFKKILSLLDNKRKKNFYLIIFFAVVGSIFEVFSVITVGPFISLLTNPNVIYESEIINKIFKFISLDYKFFVVCFGGFLCLLIFISNSLLILMSWKSHKFGQFTGSYFSQLLFNNYLERNYLTHKNSNSSFFTKNIIFESRRCSDGVIGPLTTLIARFVILISICISLFFINFFITFFIFSFLIFGYLFLYLVVKKKLKKINEDLSFHEKSRYKITDNAFKGVKEIKISLAEETFKNLFLKSSDKYAYSQSLAQILAQFPRFIFETISIFLIVIFSTSFLFILNEQDFSTILPLLSMYAFAGFKIMPSLQLVYFSFATIKSNQNSIDIIYNDLQEELSKPKKKINTNQKIIITNSIEFKNIDFKYQGVKILNNINFEIKKNQVVGIFGQSGSGKSTFIDLLSGLIDKNNGEIYVDKNKSEIYQNPFWFNNISYLSQNIFVMEGSLKENITFGIKEEDLNYDKVNEVINLANLKNLLEKRSNFDKDLGYSGMKISGGEKQRVGIARALYKDNPVLIFDEPTSSLDEENEKLFRDTILKIKKDRFIIIISHNKDTLGICDKIYKLENQKLNLRNGNNL